MQKSGVITVEAESMQLEKESGIQNKIMSKDKKICTTSVRCYHHRSMKHLHHQKANTVLNKCFIILLNIG